MKVCLIGFSYPPPTVGGHGNVMKDLSENFRKLNHNVDVYCWGNPTVSKNPYRKIKLSKSINSVNCLGCKIHRIITLNMPLVKILHFGVLIRNILKNEDFDIYHVHIAPLAYLLNKKPLVVTAHTTTYGEAESIKYIKNSDIRTFLYYISFKTYGYLLDKIVYKKADKIIVVNDHIKNELKNIYKVPDSKIEIIYNGVDINSFYPIANKKIMRQYFNINPDAFVVLYVGRLAERKNINLIIDAMDKLKTNKNIVALIAGKGYMYKVLKKKIRDNKLEDKVKLLGFVKDEDLTKLYNTADVFVQPSIYEGMPLTLLEAQACSIPIISTNFEGVNNIIIDNETGFILNKPSAEELAEKIKFLFNNKKILNEMKSRCLNNVYENFTIDKTVQRHLALYEKMVTNTRKVIN